MKKSVFTFVVSICVFMICLAVCTSAASIKIGDYVVMGKYNGEEIVWRCVDIDENGPLMLSDKILCFKAYDFAGDNTDGSHGFDSQTEYYRSMFGSDRWDDSNIRAWLNSSDESVDYTCGNAPTSDSSWFGMNEYAEETGFLSDNNFTAAENGFIKSVYLKAILNDSEISEANAGSEYLSDNFENYSDAYGMRLYDKFFLLSAEHISRISANFSGSDNVIIAYPTAKAVENSEFKGDEISTTLGAKYWLSTPHNQNLGDGVRVVCEDGSVKVCFAASVNVGIRPAFYLNFDVCAVNSGEGTKTSPYKYSVVTSPYIYTNNVVKNSTSTSVSFDVYYSNFTSVDSIRVMVVCYDGDKITYLNTTTISTFNSATIAADIDENTDKVKIFAWDDVLEIPLCSASVINLN